MSSAGCGVGAHGGEDGVGDVAFEGADGLAVAVAAGASPGDVGAGAGVTERLGEGDVVDRVVDATVAAEVQAMAFGVACRCWDGGGAVVTSERVVVTEPAHVGDLADQGSGHERAAAVQREQVRSEGTHETVELSRERVDLARRGADPLEELAGDPHDGTVEADEVRSDTVEGLEPDQGAPLGENAGSRS